MASLHVVIPMPVEWSVLLTAAERISARRR
jgi:hypothetical protein